MSRFRSPSSALARAALLAAGLASAASADWLVTTDGARLETKGTWKVAGRQVLFHLPNGTLSSIRLSEVDLDASAVATTEARDSVARAALAAETPPPRREAVIRITEKDIPPVEAVDEEGAPAATAAVDRVPSPMEVVDWEKIEAQGGEAVEIFGTVRNGGRDVVTAPTLLAMIYDEEGGLIATAEGTINSPSIPPGESANFRVSFPGIVDFAEARFDFQGLSLRANSDLVEEGSNDAEEVIEEEALEPEPPEDGRR